MSCCRWVLEVYNFTLFSFFFFFLKLLQLYCPSGISPIENSGCLPCGKPAATESRYPTYGACWVFKCFHNPSNSDMDSRIFNARTDVNACDCALGCTDTVRESALQVDSGRKISCRTGKLNLRRRRTGPMFYQLSYIPTFLIEYGDLTDTRKNFFEEKYFIFHAEFTCSPRTL